MAPQALNVVAWILSMSAVVSGKPQGYNYPVPEQPFIEGSPVSTTPAPDCVPEDLQDNPYYASLLEMGLPICSPTLEYDDYDPSDIPEDQAKPKEVTEAYNYPVPENPLVLPTKPTTAAPLSLPDCVPVGEEDLGDNLFFLDEGVMLCPEELPTYTEAPAEEEVYDDYDPNDIPEDQAKPEEVTEGYNYPVPDNPLVLPTKPTIVASLPLPDCVPVGEEELGDNPYFLDKGVPLCPDELPINTEAPAEEEVYDDYDPNDIPEDQAKPEDVTEGYNYPVPDNPLVLPTKPTTPAPLPLPDCVLVGEEDLGDNPYFLDKGVPLCLDELPIYTEAPAEEEVYDDYDSNDIPEDQAKPEEVNEGYNYPVPENPLVLPTKPTTPAPLPLPDCVPVEEEDLGDNPYFLDQGVPLCPEEIPAYTETLEVIPLVEDYDDYDPSDIPEDQAKPEEVTEGYNYPVPENPLTLPTTPSTTPLSVPDCVTEDDPLLETFLELGIQPCQEDIPAYTPTEAPAVEEYYDDYDPSDIPEDQAKPDEVTEGYNYPVPENPLVLPTKPTTPAPLPLPDCVPVGEEDLGDNPYFLDQGVPLCPEELPVYTEALAEEEVYDDYDPNDIPEDQAKPEEVTEGYNYPVPDNPLVLPTKPTTPAPLPLPDCVPVGEEDLGDNPYFLDQRVPLCPEELPTYTEAPVEEVYDDYDPSDIPEDQAKPVEEGYNYPVPENPLTLPAPEVEDIPSYSPETTHAPLDYDDYDPSDIPADQAAPAAEGYSYPVPENPLQLPSRSRKPKLVTEEQPEGLTIGLTHLDTDSYDPGNYDHNSPDYLEESAEEEERSSGPLITQGGRSSESGVSLTGPGHIISFHVPEGHVKMMEKLAKVGEKFGAERHVDPFSKLLGGELLPPVLRKMEKGNKESNIIRNGLMERKREREQTKAVSKAREEKRARSKVKNQNKRTRNQNRASKQKHTDRKTTHSRKNKSTTAKSIISKETTTKSTSTQVPRGGRNVGLNRKGRKNISVKQWLMRG